MSSMSKSSSITSESSVDSSDSVPIPRGQTAVVNQRGIMPMFPVGGASYPHGRMPIFSGGGLASQVERRVAQDTSQNVPAKEDSPPVGRPIVNKVYDPNFAMIGLPVDPFLRQLMLNPSFGTDKRE